MPNNWKTGENSFGIATAVLAFNGGRIVHTDNAEGNVMAELFAPSTEELTAVLIGPDDEHTKVYVLDGDYRERLASRADEGADAVLSEWRAIRDEGASVEADGEPLT